MDLLLERGLIVTDQQLGQEGQWHELFGSTMQNPIVGERPGHGDARERSHQWWKIGLVARERGAVAVSL